MTESLRYPPMPPVPESQLVLSRRERKQQKRETIEFGPGKLYRRVGAVALCLTTLMGGTYKGFMYDQTTLAQMAWGNDPATVHTLLDQYENYTQPETYVYVIPGTGIRDATPTIARPIEASIKSIPNVRLLSLREGSHPQILDTYSAIDATIDRDYPPDRIVVYGMSAGGKEALTIAAHLRETLPKTDLTIVLSSTPYDQDSAYQLRGNHNNLPLIADLSAKLNLRGGPLTRLAIETYNRRDQCQTDGHFDLKRCLDLIPEVAAYKLTPKSTSNELFEWQVAWTRVTSASGDIAKLKNVAGGPFTSILYINTTKDTIVDEKEAIPKFQADAEANNIPFTIMKLDTPHASENKFAKQYNDLVLKQYFGSISAIYAGIYADEQEINQVTDSWQHNLSDVTANDSIGVTVGDK